MMPDIGSHCAVAAIPEQRIQSVMKALDLILDDPTACDEDWETYLRRIAISAIEAGEAN